MSAVTQQNEGLTVKYDVDGVLTDVEETFYSCMDEGLEKDREDFLKKVQETTNVAYRERNDLVSPHEERISEKMRAVKENIERETGAEPEVVISTSREGVGKEDLENVLREIGLDGRDYDRITFEDEKWYDCDVLVEDNPQQIHGLINERDKAVGYYVKNGSSELVYGQNKEVEGSERCEVVDGLSGVVEHTANGFEPPGDY
ncbi:MAG: hypothetical protein ABEJ72_04080 [Candidatus Aenigmatarchaeota archaeon]